MLAPDRAELDVDRHGISMNSSSLIQTNDGSPALSWPAADRGHGKHRASIVIEVLALQRYERHAHRSIILSNGLAGAAASTVTYTMAGGRDHRNRNLECRRAEHQCRQSFGGDQRESGNTGISAAMGIAAGTRRDELPRQPDRRADCVTSGIVTPLR